MSADSDREDAVPSRLFRFSRVSLKNAVAKPIKDERKNQYLPACEAPLRPKPTRPNWGVNTWVH